MAPCGWCLLRVCAGTRRSKYLKENLEAAAIQLTPEEVQELNTIFSHDQVVGERYYEEQMVGQTFHYGKHEQS